MRVYHRLIHIRDQRERHEEIPDHITSHPVFKLTTEFRLHVQKRSAPITKTSALVVDVEGMQIFGQLAGVLREQGSVVMIYLVACILERLFGKDTIEDIEAIRGDLGLPDIIDGKAVFSGESMGDDMEMYNDGEENRFEEVDEVEEFIQDEAPPLPATAQHPTGVFGLPSGQPSFFAQPPQPPPSVATSAFGALANASTGTTNVFGGGSFGAASSSNPTSVFGSVFPSASKPAEPVAETKKPQPVFGSLAGAPPLGGGMPPPSGSARGSLANAPPLGEAPGEVQKPSTSPPSSFFGTTSTFGASTLLPILLCAHS